MKYKQCVPFLVAMLISSNSVVYAQDKKEEIGLEFNKNEDFLISEQAIELLSEETEKELYSVPVKMLNAANPSINSMGNDALEGNARITIQDNVAEIELDFKAVKLSGLYGHLLKLWTYPQTDKMDYSWWNDSEYEKESIVKAYFEDYGLEYTNGDEEKFSFIKTVAFQREVVKEKSIFIRISVDAMAGFDQVARLDFDWDNAIKIEATEETTQATTQNANEFTTEATSEIITEVNSETTTEETTKNENNTIEKPINPPKIKASRLEVKNNEKIEIEIEGEEEIYYTLDGSKPNKECLKYNGKFEISGSNQAVIINAVAIKNDKISDLATLAVKFVASGSNSDDFEEVISDGKYWLSFNLWNMNIDQQSMGDAAFNNNRQALVTVSGGRAKIEIATNPVIVSGYTSALKDIKSSEVNINLDSKASFTTNTRFDGSEHKFDYVTKFSFELDELNKEFVNVQINVPYTPMDNITSSDGGYVSARLKLNWSSLEGAGVNDKLNPDSSTATGSSDSDFSQESLTNYSDEKTEIKIEAEEFVLPAETSFEISLINEEDEEKKEEYEVAVELLEGKSFRLYEINAKNGIEEVKPNGVVKIYFPINDDKTEPVIYRIIKEDSKTEKGKTELEFEKSTNKDFYVVTVKEFGYFAIVTGDKIEKEPIESLEEEKEILLKEEKENSFKDIKEHWARDYILKGADKGWFNGINENCFAPNLTATRAMFITVLGRFDGFEKTKYLENKFNDVNENDYFYPYALWARENSIIFGTSENKFSPELEITREQAAVILYNYAKNKGIELKDIYRNDFKDSALISQWAKEGVLALSQAGIIKGRNDGAFDPKGKITRAEIAVMLVNLKEEYQAEEDNKKIIETESKEEKEKE